MLGNTITLNGRTVTRDDYVRQQLRRIRCDCGGPAMGTAHAPDCSWELAAEDFDRAFDDLVFQEDEIATVDDCFGCDPWDDENFGKHAASKSDAGT